MDAINTNDFRSEARFALLQTTVKSYFAVVADCMGFGCSAAICEGFEESAPINTVGTLGIYLKNKNHPLHSFYLVAVIGGYHLVCKEGTYPTYRINNANVIDVDQWYAVQNGAAIKAAEWVFPNILSSILQPSLAQKFANIAKRHKAPLTRRRDLKVARIAAGLQPHGVD